MTDDRVVAAVSVKLVSFACSWTVSVGQPPRRIGACWPATIVCQTTRHADPMEFLSDEAKAAEQLKCKSLRDFDVAADVEAGQR